MSIINRSAHWDFTLGYPESVQGVARSIYDYHIERKKSKVTMYLPVKAVVIKIFYIGQRRLSRYDFLLICYVRFYFLSL